MEPKPNEAPEQNGKEEEKEENEIQQDSGNPEDPNSASYDERKALQAGDPDKGPDLAQKYKKKYEYYVPEIVNK